MTRLKRRKELPSQHRNDVRFGTPQDVAAYRAQRLAALKPDTIIEVGAGAGFQTAAFAKYAKVIAIDIDKERMSRGSFPNAIAIAGDALDQEIFAQAKAHAAGKVVIFLDPERPPAAEHRKLSDIKPNLREFIALYSQISEDIAIELPPFLAEIPFPCEREYLSIDGKLNRLTIYLGSLKRCEISVVQLGGERVEHNGEIPQLQSADVRPKLLLEPDAALQHAGLVPLALTSPVTEVHFGKRVCYFSEQRQSGLFTHYTVLAIGKQQVIKALERCGTIILHGSMSQNEQRDLLRELHKHCKGMQRLHLFIGSQWCITKKSTTEK